MTKLRAVLVGAGWVARARYLPALRSLPGVELVGVCEHTPGAIRSELPESIIVSSSLDAVLELRPDVVFVCTPPWLHHDHSIAALAAGADVLCEKPMAMTSAEARSMYASSREHGGALCVSHNFLWSVAMGQARRRLDHSDGLQYLTATQLSSSKRRLPSWHRELAGGLIFDELPHMIYVMSDLAGTAPAVVDVRAHRRDGEVVGCDVMFDFGQTPGSLAVVLDAPISEWHVSAVCANDVVDIDLFRDTMVATGSDGSHKALDVLGLSARVTARHLLGFSAAGLRSALGRQFWGHDRLIAQFCSFVVARRAGDPSALPPVSESRALQVVDCVETIVEALAHD